MANPYDEVVDSWQRDNNRAPATAAPNPYDAVVGDLANERQQRARAVFEKALTVNPDQAAESKKLMNTTGLPLSLVERNLDEVKRKERARMLDLARMAQDSPVLARQITDPSFTNQTHDHLDNLSALEQTFNVLRAVPAGAARGVGGLVAGSGELIDIGARNIGLTAVSRAVRDLTGADLGVALDVAGSLKFAGSGWKMLADAIGPDKEAQNFATDVAGGIGQLIQQIGVQIATGGTASLVSLFSQGADAMADKTQGDKASQAMRDTAVLTGASITALTEKYGVDALLNRVPPAIKNSALRWIADKLVAGGIEATQEITEGVLQDVVRKLLTNPNATIGDGSLYEASVAGTSAAIVRAALGVRSRGAQEVQKGQQAERDADNLKAQFDLAAQALLRERNPDEFRSLVQTMADNTEGAPKEVYVDAEVLNQLAPEVLNQLPQSVRDALPDALAANDVVAIPVGDVLTVAPGTPLEQVLVENARIGDPMAMSQAEAKVAGSQAQAFLAQEAERVIQQAQDQQAMQASSDRVKQGVLDQLTSVGRFRKDVNEAYATWTAAFYTTLAGRTGMTPEQMAAKYPLRVVGQSGQGGVLNAMADQTQTPEFQNFFGNSKVVDAGGKPLVVYHGTNQTITAFDPAKIGTRDAGFFGSGFYFTPDEGQALDYADTAVEDTGEGDAVAMPLYVSLQNPFIWDMSDAGADATRAALAAFGIKRDSVRGNSAALGNAKERQTFNRAVRAAGFDGVIVRDEDGVQEVVAFESTQIKSATDNTGQFDPANPNIFEQRGVQEKGKAVPTTVDATANVESAFAFAGTQSFPNNRDFKLALQARVIEAAKAAKVKLDEFTQGTEQYLVRLALADGLTALRTNANAVGWYNEKVTKALRLVSLIHPEIATDPQAKFAFVWAMAVTSNGLKVDKNFELAEKVYQGYKATGQMPTDVGIGTAAEAINRSLGLYNTLIAKHGFEVVERFMTTLQPAGEVEKFTGNKVTGENKTTQVYGAAALGPKIGNGFFMNLYGRFEQLTMDRWLMRTWGRWTGTLVEANPAQVKAKRTLLKGLIQSLTPADKKAFEAIIKRKLTVGDVDAVGQAIWKASQKPVNRKAMAAIAVADETVQARFVELMGEPKKGQERVSVGDELRKAGNALTKYLDGQKEAPSGPPERGNIRKVFAQVLAELQQTYPALTMSDLQALLWYPEKRLYDAAKTSDEATDGYEDDEAPDYANAAAKLARSQGIPDADIAAASAAVDAELQAAVGAAGVQRGERGPGDRAGNQGEVNGQLEQAGDRAGRSAGAGSAPLPGAPVIEGATGPDPRLVAVAEQYARENGIDLQRQAEYVQVDPARAARIAAAYEAMQHAPQDPAVKEAYDNLIRQTVAQYRALEAAGYKFWFIDPTSDPYKSPWDAMRDLRANQTMGVFATEAGFGSGATELNVEDNPLLADTGLRWPYGSPDGEPKRVLANDLFRAVHDAFGHGLEGTGFRAQGEENAWQAHIRLFTGSAKGAITSETRGQNSWLNFGPYGESNQTAKVEDTVFADQKTGLMPEWTWTEGLAGDMPTDVLAQGPRGTFNPKSLELALNENADLSTFLHETGHFFLEVMADLASQPGAPADVQQDMAALLKWFGVADLATWNGYSLDQKRPYHERFAESFEQYLMEGQAPSLELQPLFRKFRAWMLNVYKSIKAFIDGHPDSDIKLSPEIRQVFDRMLASDEQIAQANEVAGLLPNEEADAEATERLTARSLRDLKWTVNARAREIKKLQDQAKTLRQEVEAEVTLEVNAMPEFRAQAALDALQVNPDYTVALKTWNEQRAAALAAASEQIKADLLAANPDVKGLQKGQLLAKNKKVMANQAEAQVLAWEAQNPKPRKADNATDADLAVIADSFGYSDADAMLAAIDAIGKKSDVIEGMTDQRMLERHGDLIDQRAIEAAANEAVHNEARARSLATELRSQAEMLNPRTDTGRTSTKGSKITVNALVEAAKQFAANVVSKTPLRDLKAKAWQHTAAERRAAKRWQEATAKGETQEAVKAKQDQMLNNAAAKAAMDAQAEMRKMLEFFRRVIKDNNEKVVEKGRDPDVVNAARAVLAAYGVAPKAGKTALEYLALVEKNDPAMYAALQPSVQGALNMAQPLDALTMDELRGLHEEIQAMWHLAKRSRQMEVDGNMLDLDDAEAELQDRMQVIGVPTTMPGDTGAVTPREELARKLQFAGSILRRVEQWAQGMGNEFTRLVFQPVKDAADRYRADRVKYRKAYQALVDNVAPTLRKGEIDAPELGYTFGKGHNGIGHAELLHAILHTGNNSNKRKLLLGRNWATENADGTLNTARWDAFLQRMHDTGVLTKAHYDFAQGVWDLLEQTKPLAQKTHRDVFGRYFAEVTADSFDTPFGSYTGGYVPAQADPRIVQDADLRKLAELENENMSFSFPGTNKGFTKGRVEYNRPLMLDLRTIGQHIDKVLLFSHMEPAVRDVQKLLSRKGVSYSLGRIDPTVYAGMLTPWLNRSARQVVETPVVGDGGISRVLSAARGRAGMALMFANVSNAVQQLTGFSLAAIKVKPASMMRATAQFIRSPKKTAKAVSEASSFMANRMENEISAVNEAMDAILLDPSLYEKAQAWSQKHAYFLQTAMANSMEPIIWSAAYNEALEEGRSEKDAVRHADSVIRTTQGSTLPEDVSRIETGPAYARMVTQFIGYFNMMANTNGTALQQLSREMGLRKGAGKALGIITLGMLAPIWVAEAIAQAMRGGPDDEDKDGYLDDWLAAVFGMGTIKGALAMVPFIGQLANAGIARFNGNPADDRVSLSPAVSLLESAVGVPYDIYKAIAEPDRLNARNAVRDVASAVSIVTGLPAYAIARPLGYLAAVEQGKVEPTDALDLARGLVTGSPSPASK